ncbi:hypothetical protein P3T34_003546 [Kitasatospora sp. MAP12-44]|nr:hypothetical protein [Kitasatospora sp. MAP12-44]MDH6111331.1 hypothetical protein [Kitasatospora sp. MAP12-44]
MGAPQMSASWRITDRRTPVSSTVASTDPPSAAASSRWACS